MPGGIITVTALAGFLGVPPESLSGESYEDIQALTGLLVMMNAMAIPVPGWEEGSDTMRWRPGCPEV